MDQYFLGRFLGICAFHLFVKILSFHGLWIFVLIYLDKYISTKFLARLAAIQILSTSAITYIVHLKLCTERYFIKNPI